MYLCFSLILPNRLVATPEVNQNLLVSIVESSDIYQMTEKDKWTLISGNPNYMINNFSPIEELLKDKSIIEPLKNPDISFGEKMDKAGNLFLLFNMPASGIRRFTINKYCVEYHFLLEATKKEIHYPRVATLTKDIIWLCRNKWLLKKLSEGQLSLEDYRMSPHELTLIMRFCPAEWRGNLVKYAVSDNFGRNYRSEPQLTHILVDALFPAKEFPLHYSYLKGVDTFDMYYTELMKTEVGELREMLKLDYKALQESLENKRVLSEKEQLLITAIFSDGNLSRSMLSNYSELKLLRSYIIKHKDLRMLKIYMKRVERRQSVADIPVLGEFLQSELYLNGSLEIKDTILDQCALRKEKEIVWLLADSAGLAKPIDDRPLEEMVVDHTKVISKAIMIEFTGKDLGDDPEVWKKWYRDQ